jgi:NAD(P)H-hydrate epimerase
MKIVTSEQMRQIEQGSEQAGVSTDALMENAGLGVATAVRRHLEQAIGRRFTGQPILFLIGPGNNGADGLVAARHLYQWFARPIVYLVRPTRDTDPKLDSVRAAGVPIVDSANDVGQVQLRKALENSQMVVDAFLGIGKARPIEGAMKAALAQVVAAKAQRPDLLVLALDIPSGMNADTGQADPACLAADITITLGYPKVGLFMPPGSDLRGLLETADIGVSAGLDDGVHLELMTPEWAKSLLPKRPQSAHKGTFGRALIVAGSRNYVGAAYLAATGAMRVGAGLVTLALPESLRAAVASKAAEPTYLPLPESSPGVPSAESGPLILDNLGQYDALLVGCGLGQAGLTRLMVERVLLSPGPAKPVVVDADGLNVLAMTPEWWRRFLVKAVLTPHPGEMARLLGRSGPPTPQERIAIATQSAASWNKVVVLKGAYTVVAYPDGRAMLSPLANPGLASAGTGDVLAGAIAGLLSQGLSLEDAAALGVYLHGAAGELVRGELGDMGMVASDLLPALPKAIKALRTA